MIEATAWRFTVLGYPVGLGAPVWLLLGLESTSSRMSRIARATTFDLELLSLDELLARVDAVTAEDVAELARELYDPAHLSAACIGRTDESFRSALAPVSEALAAA